MDGTPTEVKPVGRSSRCLLLLLLLTIPASVGAEPDPRPDLATRAIARLTRALGDPDRGVRYAAVMALGKAGGDPVAIAGRLRDPAPCVRREAGWWLRRAGPAARRPVEIVLLDGTDDERAVAAWTLSGFGADAVPALTTALGDAVREVRMEALAALRRLGPVARPAAAEVRAHLEAGSRAERYEAALTLAVIAPGANEAALPVLLPRIRGQKYPPDEALAGVFLTGKAGQEALAKLAKGDAKWRIEQYIGADEQSEIGPYTGKPRGRVKDRGRTRPSRVAKTPATVDAALVARLADQDVRTRLRAALDLGAAGADAALLAPLLEDPERDVRIAAALALGGAGGDAPAALRGALSDANPRVRRAAIVSLGRRGAAGASVAPFLADDNLAISDAAFKALLTAGDDAAIPVARVLGTRSYAAVRYAPFVFEALGTRGAPATEILAGLLGDEDVNVREAAARCLFSIGPAATAAVPALIRALGDERLCVVSHAAMALGATGLGEPALLAMDDGRARVRAYAAFALGWALGDARGVDQVPFEMRLPVLDAGRTAEPITLAQIDAVAKADHAIQVPLLRRGLWSSDPAIAVRSAARLTYEDIDAVEAERVMEVLLPEGQRIGSEARFEEVRSIIGSAELPAAMMYFCRYSRTDPGRTSIFGNFHRIARADEIPALLWFLRNEEQEALLGMGEIMQPFGHSDRYAREQAADAIGQDPGPDERDILRALLKLAIEDDIPGLWAPEIWMLNRFEPSSQDAELLIRLAHDIAGSEYAFRLPAVTRPLGRLRDPASAALLRELAADEDESEPHATAALARRGDETARRRLEELSVENPTALAMYLDACPRQAMDVMIDRLGDPERALDCAYLLEFGSGVESNMLHGVRWSEEIFLGLEPWLAAHPPPASLLGKIAVDIPLCRTRRLAGLLFDAQSPARPPTWWSGPQTGGEASEDDYDEEFWIGMPDEIAAFLFSVDAPRTRELLRGWARLTVPDVRDWARSALIRAGDSTRAGDLLDWMTGEEVTRILCRSDSPEVRAWLKLRAAEPEGDDRDPDDALRWYARLRGWPAHVPFEWGEDPIPPAVRKALLAGRLTEGLAGSLWPGRLADLASDPGGAAVWRRLGLRALGGDRRARAAFWSAMRCGRYRWIHYNFDGALQTLGRDPSVLPHWLADLDSNCCRISDGMAYDVFGDPFLEPAGWDENSIYDVADHGVGRPPSRHVLELFRLTGGAWVWSPILDEWGVGLENASRVSRIPAPE